MLYNCKHPINIINKFLLFLNRLQNPRIQFKFADTNVEEKKKKNGKQKRIPPEREYLQ